MKITATLLVLTFIYIVKPSAQEINTAKLDSFFNVLSTKDKSMGSFALAKNGKIVYQKVIGYTSLNPDTILATASTRYRIGSITKIFTATMIFQLIEEGKLSLDTKLSTYFPQLPQAEKITIANLLSHSSGLKDYVNDVTDHSWITYPHVKAELLDTIAKGKVHFLPGTQQQYCNSGYLLLAYILEEVTGKPYSKLLESRIVKKIGLKNTSGGEINEKGKNEAKPYKMAGKWTDVKDIYFPNIIGVGDILSTPADLITLMDALGSGKLVTAANYTQMSTFKENQTFGMGLQKVPFYTQVGLGHGGGTYGTFSMLAAFKENGITLAASVNGLNYPSNDITISILKIVNGLPFQLPTFIITELKEEDLAPFLGVYATSILPIKITVSNKGAALFAQATGQDAFPLTPIAKNKFEFTIAGIEMEFDLDKHEMVITQGGRPVLFKKE